MPESIQASTEKIMGQIHVIASKAPVPGGGGASALVGAIGLALGNMVGSLTVGKKKYADVEEDIIALNEKSSALEDKMVALIARDAEVFEPLSKAYGLPRETEEQRAYKAEVMAKCLEECCEVPLEIMRCCCEAIDICREYAAKGSSLALSDAGCGVIMLKGALKAASLNVYINTRSMADRERAEAINDEADLMLLRYGAKADATYGYVQDTLKGEGLWQM